MICKCWDARGNGDGEIASTITGDHENRITDYSTVVCLQGNTVDRNAHQNGSGVNENISFTINSTDRHAIVYRMSRFGEYLTDGSASTLKQRDYKSANDLVCVRYAVRRLTPTECARLQGFPDRWGDIEPLDISDEHEVDRWRHIYKTYCIISGLKINRSLLERPDSLKKWHDKLHTDSAEYKMWGNGIALPNAVFVLSGIAKMLRVQLLIEQLTGGADG